MTIYPSNEEVLATHARLIKMFGGSQGVRDRSALESALSRPRSGYYRDIVEEAAALLESLWQNHPFVDGKKRTAVTVAGAFLRINGYRLKFEDLEAHLFLVGLAEAGDFRFGSLIAGCGLTHTHPRAERAHVWEKGVFGDDALPP